MLRETANHLQHLYGTDGAAHEPRVNWTPDGSATYDEYLDYATGQDRDERSCREEFQPSRGADHRSDWRVWE